MEASRPAAAGPWCVFALSVVLASTLVAGEVAGEFRMPAGTETTDSETAVEIPDVALRSAVEAALGKTRGDAITRDEMATLRGLSATGVGQLAGIEHAVNLRSLSSYSGTLSDLSPLAGLTALTRLHLPINQIADVSPLAGLTALTWLTLDSNEIADVSPLAGLTALNRLTLDSNEIADVSPLAGLTALTWLDLFRNEIADVSPLAGLTALNTLYLGRNQIADVSPLAGMTALNTLDLRSNEMADVSPLAGLTALTVLYLGFNEIADVSPLADMTALVELELHSNEIADASPLAGLTALNRLTLDSNEIADVSPLAGMTALTWLDLFRNEIADVSPLAGLTALNTLYLGRNQIADVSPLAGMTALNTLDLRSNEMADVSPLAGMTALNTLYLGRNQIADVAPLAGLTALNRLTLDSNEIADVSPLAGMTALTGLNLGFNEIADASPLAGLTALTVLYLGFNQIADVSPLAGMTALTWLDLFRNEIADVSPLAGLTALNTLYLNGNHIADVSPLAGLTALNTLYLGGNEIADVLPLAGMTALVELQLGANQIADVSPLAGLTALTWLTLDSNEIADVSPLAGLTALNTLSLDSNEIADVAPLVANDGLGGGDSVYLTGNFLGRTSREAHIPTLLERGVEVQFTEFAELLELLDAALRSACQWALYAIGPDDLSGLTALDASDRGVEDLTGLEGADDLYGIFLDRNKITDIAPLAGLGSLRVLTLSHNTVEDWTPLAGMSSLRLLALDGNSLREVPVLPSGLGYLYLAGNSISSVSSLADMWGLVELDVSGNAITSLEPLAGQGQLQYLHVHDNQIADISPLNFQPLRELHMANNAVRDISPLLDGEQLLVADVRRNPLADDALRVLDTLRERRVTVLAGEAVPYFPAAGEGRQGFVRIMNHSDEAGHAFIEGVDDAGVRAGPVRLELGARQAVHFNSADLEHGSAAKGLASIGAPMAGDWRLSVISALDVEVLSYIRTEDGFVTAMHDVAADAMAPFFNPGSNRNQRSILRVVNTEAEPAKWTTGGYDDRGSWHPMTGSLLVRPQQALTLTAQALEDAHGLGDGSGKWRLRVRGFPWFAMSLLESPTGHLTNLSTAPAHTTQLEDGATMHRLPLFPAAGGARQGFARVINRSYTSGEVTIWAVDDAGTRSGPVRLTMRPRRVVHFNSADLEGGNAAKGLEGGVGIGDGDWRLEITSKLDLMALAYARTADGFLTSLHDLAPVAEDGSHRVVFFNPGSNARQVSKLRLINDGDRGARVTIAGIDDQGNGSGRVERAVPAGSALTFTAAELEAGGERVAGSLGDGQGKWRLRVASEEPIAVMSLLETPSGHLTNVSTGTAD